MVKRGLLKVRNKNTIELARRLGYKDRIPPQKAPFNSHGQPVYSNGKNYITPDIDGHNVSDGWKMFDKKGKRLGTYDKNLNRIKDIKFMFNIKIEKNEFFNDWGDLIVKSKIIINDFSEYFDLPVSYWKVNDYKRSWVKSISQILNKNKDRAILFTSMYDLEKVNFLHSWIIYKKGNSAFIQNCILFRDDFDEFSLENIFKYIPDREIYSEYGEKISEWTTDFENIIRFYDKLKFELK